MEVACRLKLEVKYLQYFGHAHTHHHLLTMRRRALRRGGISHTAVSCCLSELSAPLPLSSSLKPCLCLALTDHYLETPLLSPESFSFLTASLPARTHSSLLDREGESSRRLVSHRQVSDSKPARPAQEISHPLPPVFPPHPPLSLSVVC